MKKIFILFLIILSSCTITSNVIYEPDTDIKVYFCPQDFCQDKIIEIINDSADIKCSFYELNLPELITILKQKNAEVVIEDSTYKDDFLTGYSSALMHNKFCIFDSKIVLTGSMNPTNNGNYKNNNNIIFIESKSLAQNYLDEFYELKNNVYGKGDKTTNPIVYLGDVKIENYFCPEDFHL